VIADFTEVAEPDASRIALHPRQDVVDGSHVDIVSVLILSSSAKYSHEMEKAHTSVPPNRARAIGGRCVRCLEM
jgi:hypothetical protein